MVERLLIHPNERIDLDDVNKLSYGYTDDLSRISNKQLVSKDVLSVVSPFRIAIEDQTVPSNYGKITVYGGSFLDRSGNLVFGSSSGSELSQSLTLTGASQTFYLELQLEVVSTSLDARAFWDQTFDNGTSFPGKEYLATVPTREEVRWSIVTPISTSGFSLTTSSTSVRLPLARLSTNGSGQILSAVNPGLVFEQYKTFVVKDALSSTTTLYVQDVGPIVPGAVLNLVGTGSSPATATVTVQSVNALESTVTLTSPLSSSFLISSSVTLSGAAKYMQLRAAADPNLTGSSTHPDKQLRLFSGNESLGNSSNLMGAGLPRSDVNVSSLKNLVDFLAAQLYELKYGGVGAPAVQSLVGQRYYNNVGSIVGSKSFTASIGNGTSSVGDYNSTDGSAFASALNDAATAGPGTVVTLFIKPGTFTISSAITVPSNISSLLLIAQENGTGISGPTVALSSALTTGFIFSGNYFGAKNLNIDFQNSSTDVSFVAASAEITVSVENVNALTTGTVGAANYKRFVLGATGVLCRARNVRLNGTMKFQLAYAATVIPFVENVTGSVNGSFLIESTGFATNGFNVTNGYLKNCYLSVSYSGAVGGLVKLVRSTGNLNTLEITGNTVLQSISPVGSSYLNSFIVSVDNTVVNLVILHNTFSAADIEGVLKVAPSSKCTVRDNTFRLTLNTFISAVALMDTACINNNITGNTFTIVGTTGANSINLAAMIRSGTSTMDIMHVVSNYMSCSGSTMLCSHLLLDNTSFTSLTVENNRVYGGHQLITSKDTTQTKGKVTIVGNDYDSAGNTFSSVLTTSVLVDIGFGGTPTQAGQTVLIQGNSLRNSRPGTNTYGIRVMHSIPGTGLTGNARENAIIIKENVYIPNFSCITNGISAPVTLFGIYVDSAINTSSGTVEVINNVITDADITNLYELVHVGPRNTDCHLITGNSIGRVSTSLNPTSAVYCYGIRADGSSTVSSNHIWLLYAANSVPVVGIQVRDSNPGGGSLTGVQAQICNNFLHDFTTASDPCSAILCIDVTTAKILSNSIEYTGSGAVIQSTSYTSGIESLIASNSFKNLTIGAVSITDAVGNNTVSSSISNNSIDSWRGAVLGFSAIACTNVNNLSISGNTITELATLSDASARSSSRGVSLASCNNCTISGNNFIGTSTPSASNTSPTSRASIAIASSNDITITGNNFKWQRRVMDTNNLIDAEVYLASCSRFAVTGNSHCGHTSNIGTTVHPLVAGTACTAGMVSGNVRQGYGIWFTDQTVTSTNVQATGQIGTTGVYSNYATIN